MEVTLEPRVLRWVRDRAGLSVEDLARKVGTRPAKVAAWETNGQLTAKQAEKLADKTRAPLGYLYLDVPPAEALPVTNFRTLGKCSSHGSVSRSSGNAAHRSGSPGVVSGVCDSKWGR